METNCTWNRACGETSLDKNVFSLKDKPSPEFIDDEVKHLSEICIQIFAFFIISSVGTVANVINILVYWKQGLKDSITVGFLTLSISDLVTVIMCLMTSVYYICRLLMPDSNIDFKAIIFITASPVRRMFYSTSCVITAFLSVERCFCVVFPFKVKNVFTRQRTMKTLIGIFLLHAFILGPFVASQTLKWKPTLMVNETILYQLSLHFTPNREEIEHFTVIVTAILIPTTSQVVVTVCMIVLVKALKESTKFRQSVVKSSKSISNQISVDMSVNLGLNVLKKDDNKESSINNPANMKKTPKPDLSGRDSRLVKTMIFVLTIMSVSNVPFLMLNYAQRFVPELTITGRYRNLVSLCISCSLLFITVNGTVNIFVYYRNSSKYREVFAVLFRCK